MNLKISTPGKRSQKKKKTTCYIENFFKMKTNL